MPRTADRTPLPPLGSAAARTVHADVASRIRQAILDGDLSAGTRLVQADLAAALDVSVTPVREALRGLASEGLVDFDAFRGAVVHSPTLDEMDEIYSIRRVLTPLSVERSVAAVAPEDLELARSLCDEMAECREQATWVELNRRFHLALDGSSHSPHLSRVLARLADMSVVYVNLSLGPGSGGERREDADDDHQRLVEAYAARDVADASAIAVEHLTRTIDAVRRAFRAGVASEHIPARSPRTRTTTATPAQEEQLR
ncbi:MAG: GntR family transcriptional regulator [Actinomycetota bacterium]|nr:GntR family transcriptional regulator [Actinomycetota bacterium]